MLALQERFAAGAFNLTMDKGTIDALLGSPAFATAVPQYAAQLFRVLEPGGLHASISSCMPSICSSYFTDAGFLLRVEQVPSAGVAAFVDECT